MSVKKAAPFFPGSAILPYDTWFQTPRQAQYSIGTSVLFMRYIHLFCFSTLMPSNYYILFSIRTLCYSSGPLRKFWTFIACRVWGYSRVPCNPIFKYFLSTTWGLMLYLGSFCAGEPYREVLQWESSFVSSGGLMVISNWHSLLPLTHSTQCNDTSFSIFLTFVLWAAGSFPIWRKVRKAEWRKNEDCCYLISMAVKASWQKNRPSTWVLSVTLGLSFRYFCRIDACNHWEPLLLM